MKEYYSLLESFPKRAFNFSCIYKFYFPNGKIYIGQTQCFYDRMWTYKKGRFNLYMDRAVKKYGIESLQIYILEKDIHLSKLNEREQFYFDTLKPFKERGYNIATEAGSNRGFKHSEETKESISKSLKGRKLKPRNREHCKSISFAKKGSKQKDTTIQKRVDKVNKYVYKLCKVTNIILDEFASIKEASEKTGINRSSIGQVANCSTYKWNGKIFPRILAGGFKWKYKKDL